MSGAGAAEADLPTVGFRSDGRTCAQEAALIKRSGGGILTLAGLPSIDKTARASAALIKEQRRRFLPSCGGSAGLCGDVGVGFVSGRVRSAGKAVRGKSPR